MEIFAGNLSREKCKKKKNIRPGGGGGPSLAWISAHREEGDVREEARGGP